jgi:hypothetical protein
MAVAAVTHPNPACCAGKLFTIREVSAVGIARRASREAPASLLCLPARIGGPSDLRCAGLGWLSVVARLGDLVEQ